MTLTKNRIFTAVQTVLPMTWFYRMEYKTCKNMEWHNTSTKWKMCFPVTFSVKNIPSIPQFNSIK